MTLSPDVLSVVVRALGFVALFQAAGAALFLVLFGPSLVSARAAVMRLGGASACIGIILVLAHGWLDAARMAGDFSGLTDMSLLRLAARSSGGLAQGVQLAGLALIAAAVAARAAPTPSSAAARAAPLPYGVGTARGAVALAGALIAIGAFALTGHTSECPPRLLLAALLLLHLMVVAFWFGALLPLRFVTRWEAPAAAARIVRSFSALATWLVPLIGLAGVSLAALLAGRLAVVRTPYGQLLLGKLGAFLLLLVFAGYNKWHLTPALAADPAPGVAATGRQAAIVPGTAVASTIRTAQLLRRSMAAEYLLIVSVLCATSALTTFFSPR